MAPSDITFQIRYITHNRFQFFLQCLHCIDNTSPYDLECLNMRIVRQKINTIQQVIILIHNSDSTFYTRHGKPDVLD